MHLLPGSSLPPLQVFLEVTYKCNLSCDFCQFLQAPGDGSSLAPGQSSELSTAELKRIVGEIPRTAIVSFTGGEPFAKAGFMDLLAFASERNKTHIFTNATLITSHIAESLVALGATTVLSPGLVLVGISLEGLQETHNRITRRSWAFAKTIAALKALSHFKASQNRRYPLIELKTVISEENVGELYQIYLLAKANKADIFNVMTMNMLPQTTRTTRCADVSYMCPPPAVKRLNLELLRSELTKIYEDAAQSGTQIRTTPQGFDPQEIIDHYDDKRRLARYRCYYPWYGAGISAYGDVLICPYKIIGNVRKNSLRKLLNNEKARKFRRALHEDTLFPGCWGCCMLVPRRGRTRDTHGHGQMISDTDGHG